MDEEIKALRELIMKFENKIKDLVKQNHELKLKNAVLTDAIGQLGNEELAKRIMEIKSTACEANHD